MTGINLGLTIHTLGELLVGFTAIMVHYRFLKEHKVDKVVLHEMKTEQIVGILGVLLIVMGYMLEIGFRFF